MASIIDSIEGVWDAALESVRDAIAQAEARIQRRHDQEQQVNQLTASSGDRFRIEPDQVPQVIADLDEAVVQIHNIRTQAEAIASTSAPGYDEVSNNAVRQISEMAMGADGSLRVALDSYENEIVKTKEKLRAQLQTYLGMEQVNVPPASAWPAG